MLHHLDRAYHHVEQGCIQLARQRATILRMEARGDDAGPARTILATLEEMQAAHIFDRDRLERALAGGDQPFSRRDDFRRLESAQAVTHASINELRWYHGKLAETGRALRRSKHAVADSCEILLQLEGVGRNAPPIAARLTL